MWKQDFKRDIFLSVVHNTVYLCYKCKEALIFPPFFIHFSIFLSLSMPTNECVLVMSLRGADDAANGDRRRRRITDIYLSAEYRVNLGSQVLPNWWQNDGGRSCDWLMRPEQCEQSESSTPFQNVRVGEYGLWESAVCPNRMYVSHSACPQTLSVSQKHSHKHTLTHRRSATISFVSAVFLSPLY